MKRLCTVRRFGAIIALGILVFLMLTTTSGVSVAGDGSPSGGSPIGGTDTTRNNATPSDTTSTTSSVVTQGLWLIWPF